MKTKYSFPAILICLSLLVFSSCKKEGLGGVSEIKGFAWFIDKTSKPTIFYIKYGASSSPGTDISKYDASSQSDTDGKFDFKDLEKGDYWIYALGSENNQNVSGGIHVELGKAELKENVQINVAP